MKASSFVALLSLSVETFCRNAFLGAGMPRQLNIKGVWVCVERDVVYCCTTLMALQLECPGVGD